jgi:nicotinamidase-related amidase
MSNRFAKRGPIVPDHDHTRGSVGLLIVDLMNPFDFEGADNLAQNASAIVQPVLRLRDAMDAISAPTIYVNDNFGEWHSEKSILVEHARERAADFISKTEPRDFDYFVIKPQLSGFYATNLPLLLPKLGVSRLVIAGLATDICVLFTAADAHMRDYALWVPQDAVAAESSKRGEEALGLMQRQLGAEVAPTSQLDVISWARNLDARGIR